MISPKYQAILDADNARYAEQEKARKYKCCCKKCKCTEKSDKRNGACLICRVGSHEEK